MDLHKYVINNYFDNDYYENIDTVKKFLRIYFTYSTEERINMMLCRKIIIILLFDNKNIIYLFDLNTLSSLLVDNAGGDEFSLNFFVAFNLHS